MDQNQLIDLKRALAAAESDGDTERAAEIRSEIESLRSPERPAPAKRERATKGRAKK